MVEEEEEEEEEEDEEDKSTSYNPSLDPPLGGAVWSRQDDIERSGAAE
jgi:hypothetical protein